MNASGSGARHVYLDNLKVLLTCLVVGHHAAQAYGPTGGFWPISNPTRSVILGPFITLNMMFFMGLFFFISGYFLEASCARKGTTRFFQDRLLRLGVPTAIWWVILFSRNAPLKFGHMWFAVDLLVLNLIYIAVRASWRRSAQSFPKSVSGTQLVAFITLLAAVTYMVRWSYPIDRWVSPLGLLQFEPAHVPQYVFLFIAGLMLAEFDWTRTFPARQGRRWVVIAVGLAAIYTLYRFLTPEIRPDIFADGGKSWQSAAFSMFESATCVAIGIGLLYLFRVKFDFVYRWLKNLSANSYGIYVVHIVPVIGVQALMRNWSAAPLLKFSICTPVAIGLSWLLSELVLRRIPGGKRVF